MVASIGAIASAAQGTSYYEKDGYYASDDPEHREASAWAGKGADALGLTGPVDPDIFRAVLEGKVPDGSGRELGRRDRDGKLLHRPGRDVTLSAPKSVSLVGLVGGDARIVDVHDRAVQATLAWIEGNAAETRMKDPATGRMVREGGQKMVAATFRHDTSRNLDPQLHTHAVIANMVQGEDGKWRSMANEKLYESKMLIGAIYRSELARGLSRLGYGIEKTHSDGRFEIAGVSRETIDAFSTRRAEIEAGMAERGMGSPSDNPRLAERAALMSRAAKRDIDRNELAGVWQRQAADLGFDAGALTAETAAKGAERESAGRGRGAGSAGRERSGGRSAGHGPRGRPRERTGNAAVGARPGGWHPRLARPARRGMGRRASLGARGGVLPDPSARRRARLEPRRGDGGRGGGRGGAAGEGRIAARCPASRHGRAAHHRPRGRRREGDDRVDGSGPGPRRDPGARPGGRQGAP